MKHKELKQAAPWLISGFIIALYIIFLGLYHPEYMNFWNKLIAVIGVLLLGNGMTYDPTRVPLSNLAGNLSKIKTVFR